MVLWWPHRTTSQCTQKQSHLDNHHGTVISRFSVLLHRQISHEAPEYYREHHQGWTSRGRGGRPMARRMTRLVTKCTGRIRFLIAAFFS